MNKTVKTKARKSLKKNKAAVNTVVKKVNHNHVKAVHYVESLVAIGDNLSSGAVAALVAHWYFGDGESNIDIILYFVAASLFVVSVWMRSILAEKNSK